MAVDLGQIGADIAETYCSTVLLPYQRAWIQDRSRYKIACWTRQGGKSFALALEVLLAAFEGRNQYLLAASQRQSEALIRAVRAHLDALQTMLIVALGRIGERAPLLARPDDLHTLDMRLANGARIEALPANPATIRGPSGDLTIDEAAVLPHDKAIWAAIFPVTTRKDYRVRMASSPFGDRGMFAETFAEAGPGRRWSRHRVTVHEAMAQGLEIDWEAIKEALGDPDAIAQEYECEFLSDALAAIPSELIRECLYDDAAHRPVGSSYVGVDIGRKHDRTAIATVVKDQDQKARALPVLSLHRAPFDEQWSEIQRSFSGQRALRMAIDATGIGAQLAEQAGKRWPGRVEEVTFTASVKEDLISLTRKLMEQRSLWLPASDAALIRSLGSIRKFYGTGSHLRFDAERNEAGHADEAWAFTLGVRAMGDIGPQARAPFGHIAASVSRLAHNAPRHATGKWAGF